MEDADDTDYADYAKRMRQAALDIVDAVKTNNYDKARTAVGEIDKSCTECHQSYRA
jgi:cytochrome c556